MKKTFNTSHKTPVKTLRATGTALALTLALGAATTPAHAGDDAKIMPSSFCSVAYGSQVERFSYGTGGRLSNTSNVSGYLVCPTVRDLTGDFEWWKRIEIRVDDRHPTQDIACTVSWVRDSGLTANSETKRTSGTGLRTLTYTRNTCGWGGGCVGLPAMTVPVIRCVIPGKSPTHSSSALISYYVKEHDD